MSAEIGPAVVIADGDARASAEVAAALERSGYAALEVESGREALEIARNGGAELLVLEVTLGEMTGYEICRTLRDEGNDVRIFLLSATHTDAMDRIAGLLLGADDYLAKPVDPSELVARVHRHLRRPTLGQPRNGRRPSLTRRETEILHLLARGATQKGIAKQLSISPKTVSTHIHSLFTKLDVHSRAELVARAYMLRLVEAPAASRPPAPRARVTEAGRA